jgi:hypothetical protein
MFLNCYIIIIILDGWNAIDFHRRCDEKGATLTIVKTSDGYVFGGYSDQSWSDTSALSDTDEEVIMSSNDAFLFSLKCHGGLAPMKMRIKSGQNKYAVHSSSSKGPSFGSNDLTVGNYNCNLKEGFTYISTYHMSCLMVHQKHS